MIYIYNVQGAVEAGYGDGIARGVSGELEGVGRRRYGDTPGDKQ